MKLKKICNFKNTGWTKNSFLDDTKTKQKLNTTAKLEEIIFSFLPFDPADGLQQPVNQPVSHNRLKTKFVPCSSFEMKFLTTSTYQTTLNYDTLVLCQL
jgi:hypothetical protein